MASSMSVNPRWRHSHAHEGIFITVDDSRAQGTSQRGSQRHGRRGSRSTPPWTVPVPGRADPEDRRPIGLTTCGASNPLSVSMGAHAVQCRLLPFLFY